MGVSPSEHHPVSEGRLCARGWGAHEAPLWGERLLFPTVLDGGARRRVSWAEGLSVAAERLRGLMDAGKRVGVLGSGRLSNEEAYLAARLARGALGTPHVDSSLRTPYETLLRGIRPEGGLLDLGGIHDFLRNCDLVVALEGDLAHTHPQVAYLVLEALRRGARLVTLGPVRTRLSALSQAHIYLDPTGDPEGLPQLEEALGTARDGESLTLLLAPFTSDLTRLERTVRALVRRVEAWAGGWGPGVRHLPLPLMANTRGAREMGLAPGLLPGGGLLPDPEARARTRAAWGPSVEFGRGLDASRIPEEVDGLILIREDPTQTQSSPADSRRALEGLDCLVVLDAYRSSATDRATVTLPLGAFSETRGTLLSQDGLIQRWSPATPPPGEARDGWWVLAGLLEALGARPAYGRLEDVTGEMGRVMPDFPGGFLEEGAHEPWARTVPEMEVPPPDTGALEPRPETVAAAGARSGSWSGPPASDPKGGPSPASVGSEFRLALVGVHEWDEDLAVRASPTLRRNGVSTRKLYPNGRMSMSRSDAEKLGIRDGWKVWIRNGAGEMEVPVSVRSDVEPGILLVSFGSREAFSNVLGGAVESRVTLERR